MAESGALLRARPSVGVTWQNPRAHRKLQIYFRNYHIHGMGRGEACS